MKKLLFWISGFLPCQLIEAPYLERYFICKIFGWTFLLDRFVGRGGDRYLHSHPWRWGVSIILRGHYTERLENNESRIRRSFNFIGSNKFHGLSLIEKGTWTLTIHSPKIKDWSVQYGNRIIKVEAAPEGWWREVPKGKDCLREPLE